MAFAFSPVTGLNDASQFPAKDALIREHIQTLLQQIPAYYDAQINTALRSANGWFKDKATGLILQWGTASVNSTPVPVNFPIAFPNACLVVVPAIGEYIALSVGSWAYTTTRFFTFLDSATYYPITWIAIGY